MAIQHEREHETVRLSNGEVEVVAATAYGPRIMRYALVGGANVFGFVDPKEQAHPTPFGEPWHIYGGHRLWHAPEDPIKTYVPDNVPVRADFDGGTLVLTPAPEAPTGLAKQLRVTLADQGPRVVVEHRITNQSEQPIELAIWALSVMARGGTALLPTPPFAPHPQALLPSSRIVTWPYTSLGDPRFSFGARFTRVRQDSSPSPQKIGLWDAHVGFLAYSVDDLMFVKRYGTRRAAEQHVDLGCNVEVFVDARMLELETLSPLVALAPGATATHVETWDLFGGVQLAESDDEIHAQLGGCFDRA